MEKRRYIRRLVMPAEDEFIYELNNGEIYMATGGRGGLVVDGGVAIWPKRDSDEENAEAIRSIDAFINEWLTTGPPNRTVEVINVDGWNKIPEDLKPRIREAWGGNDRPEKPYHKYGIDWRICAMNDDRPIPTKLIMYPLSDVSGIYEFPETGELFVWTEGRSAPFVGIVPGYEDSKAADWRMAVLSDASADIMDNEYPTRSVTMEIIDRLAGAKQFKVNSPLMDLKAYAIELMDNEVRAELGIEPDPGLYVDSPDGIDVLPDKQYRKITFVVYTDIILDGKNVPLDIEDFITDYWEELNSRFGDNIFRIMPVKDEIATAGDYASIDKPAYKKLMRDE